MLFIMLYLQELLNYSFKLVFNRVNDYIGYDKDQGRIYTTPQNGSVGGI